jgi:phosphonate C-P lyase system protein PhnG
MHGRKTVGRREAPSNANPAVNGSFIPSLRDIYAAKIGRFIAHSFSIYPTLTSRCERRRVDNNRYDNDTVLCECDLPTLQRFVEELETRHEVKLIKAPGICLTMVRAEDSLEKQEFFLGEALTSECEVAVDGAPGYGLCLGEEPVRAYCIAVCDALLQGGREVPVALAEFVATEREKLSARETEEFNHILRTQVDFKLMEQD